MSKKYIIGGGVAGLVYAFYNKDYTIIDKNPLGQLNGEIILGPRIFKVDYYTEQFLNDLKIPYLKKKIRIGFQENSNDVFYTCSADFKEQYSILTRGHSKVEPSFLSSGANEIEILYREEIDLYTLVFNTILSQLYREDRVINANVINIDTEEKFIMINDGNSVTYSIDYLDLVSTINYNKLRNLISLQNDENVSFLNKTFIITEYTERKDVIQKDIFHYIYSINGKFNRKTYQKHYICYEALEEVDEKSKFYDGNMVRRIYKNLPIQIEKSHRFAQLKNIELFGRFAQVDHSIKVNELLKHCIK